MDWTKLKVVYILDSDMPENINWALVKIMCLTARIESLPTEKQILKYVHIKTLTQLQEYLKNKSRDLQDILMKVLEDVQGVVKKRVKSKSGMALLREKTKAVNSNKEECYGLDKIREDKIREDKINNTIVPALKLELQNKWLGGLFSKISILTEVNRKNLPNADLITKEINLIPNNDFKDHKLLSIERCDQIITKHTQETETERKMTEEEINAEGMKIIERNRQLNKQTYR